MVCRTECAPYIMALSTVGAYQVRCQRCGAQAGIATVLTDGEDEAQQRAWHYWHTGRLVRMTSDGERHHTRNHDREQ